MSSLFDQPLHVVNVGLASFAESLRLAGAQVTQIDWSPPAQGDPVLGRVLAQLTRHRKVAQANQQAFALYRDAMPVLEGIGSAADHLPQMGERTIVHAGPPIDWQQMCGPMRGAIIGAILFEGWAADAKRAETLAGTGAIQFAPCHHHNAVAPMAGVISPSMPVWVVRNTTNGNRAFSNLNEGLGKVLRFGANNADVLKRLHWMKDVLAPMLAAALARLGPIELKPIMAQALHMGDEVHNRNSAATGLLFKQLAPALVRSGLANDSIAQVVEFIVGNDHFFLNLSMAACKAMLDAAANIEGSSMVTAMCRNGVQFGIRLSGTGDSWFSAPAALVNGLYFPGYSIADAAPDLGDSAITEAAGLGGFAMAAAPAIVKFVGGSPRDALANTLAMSHITIGRNTAFTLPALNFGGTPAGIDARKVVDTGIAPVINTGIAHRQAGVGQIGAGVTHAPLACFNQALAALVKRIDMPD